MLSQMADNYIKITSYEKETILIIKYWTHADSMWTAEQK